MTSTQRARKIFEAVIALPESERTAAVEQACDGDSALASDVLRLLRALGDRREFLRSPTAATVPFGPPSEQPGVQIGRYKLLQQIGEGGFGVVFMAEQTEPIRRRVALKVIKLGMDTRQVIAWFEAERQALALMDHPNIARVFEAGATESGRPYFAMELVAGMPITEYCDREKLGLAERVALMMPVCDAVQHAHHKGIIHRDLKPSNVLVTLQDGKPVPKVIDFGIAKAVSHRLTERTLFTEFGQFIGTPEYMSPEQADMPGLDVDARSDVYALGVLLYELLAGGPPFDGATLRSKGLDEMRRIIREDEPPRLSVRAATLAASSSEVAARRGVVASALGSLLGKEHEWIAQRCMEKDRSRRYVTPAALAEDLGRLLRNEAVNAAPPGTGYRVKKFVRRHRREVVLAAAGSGLVLLGLAGTSVGMAWAVRARDAATKAEAAATESGSWAYRTTAVMGNPLATKTQKDEHQAAWSQRLERLQSAHHAPHLLDRERAMFLTWVWSRTISSSPQDRELLRSKALELQSDMKASVAAMRGRVDPADPLWAWALNSWTQILINSDGGTDDTASAYRELTEALLASLEPSNSTGAR